MMMDGSYNCRNIRLPDELRILIYCLYVRHFAIPRTHKFRCHYRWIFLLIPYEKNNKWDCSDVNALTENSEEDAHPDPVQYIKNNKFVIINLFRVDTMT